MWENIKYTSVTFIEPWKSTFHCITDTYNVNRLLLFTTAAAAKLLHSCPTLVRPHRQQSTRLPCPWDSPGKNTAVGCHFLLQCMKVRSESDVTRSCLTQWPHGLQPTRLLHPWDFPGKSTGVGCHCLHYNRCRLTCNFTSTLTYLKLEKYADNYHLWAFINGLIH